MRYILSLMLLLSCASFYIAAQKEEASPKQTISSSERHKSVAFIRPYGVLEQSEEFNDKKKQYQNEMNGEAETLQKDAQRISEQKQEIQSEAQQLQNGGQSKYTSKEIQQSKIEDLQKREEDLKYEEERIKHQYQRLRDKYNRKEQELQMEMWDKMTKAAEIVGQEQGWGAIDVASMYVAPSLDITDDVARAMNKEYRERNKSQQEAKQQTEQEAAKQTQKAE